LSYTVSKLARFFETQCIINLDGEVANLLRTCCGVLLTTRRQTILTCQLCRQQVRNKLATSLCSGSWTRHDTTDTTNFICPRELVTDLLRGNWCNGFWPI